jgi:hypothetical protein
VTCSTPFNSAAEAQPRPWSTAATSLALAIVPMLALNAQQPPPSSSTPPSTAAMRAPSLQLVQPSSGGSVPSDRPVVFFRYWPGELTDPVDDASFQVWVDGAERTSRFRIGNGEAWGTLGAASIASVRDTSGGGGSTPRGASAVGAASVAQLAAGAHLVIARVCSVRGLCMASHDVVIAVPTAAVPPDADAVRATAPEAAQPTKARTKRHNHLKQPLTLLSDLVSGVAKLFGR